MDEKEKALKLLQLTGNSIDEVIVVMKKLCSKISEEELPFSDGFSLLDMKNVLLLRYLMNVAYIMWSKINGESIEGCPNIDLLIEYRVILERMKSLDAKTKYLIDKMIRVATTGTVDASDPSNFRANPDNMITNQDDDDDDADDDNESGNEGEQEKKDMKSEKYVPPKLAAVHYDDDRADVRRQKLLDRAKKIALNSSVISELRDEYLDTPTEIKATNSLKQKEDAYHRRKQEYEETYFTRLPLSKEEKERAKRLSTLNKLGDEITRFEDISALDISDPSLLGNKRKRGRLSKVSKAKLGKEKKKKRKKFRK